MPSAKFETPAEGHQVPGPAPSTDSRVECARCAQRALCETRRKTGPDELHASAAQERGVLMHRDAPRARGPGALEVGGSEVGMPSGISRRRSMRSKFCWFAEFCNLQCLSHFAAPFIVVRAEASVAESCEVETVHEERHKFAKDVEVVYIITGTLQGSPWREPRTSP